MYSLAKGMLSPSSKATLSMRLSSACSSTSFLEATASSAACFSLLPLMIGIGKPVAFSRATLFMFSSSISSSTSCSLAAASSLVAICLLSRDSGIVANFPMLVMILEPPCYSWCDLPNICFAKRLPYEQPSTGTWGTLPADLSRRIPHWSFLIDLRVRKRWPRRADLLDLYRTVAVHNLGGFVCLLAGTRREDHDAATPHALHIRFRVCFDDPERR